MGRLMTKLLDSLKTCSLFRPTKHRRTQLYCIGTAKSGTHSMHELLGSYLRSAHEPEGEGVIDMVLASSAGRVTDSEVVEYLLQRDRRLSLELDSSHLNIFLLHKLVQLFPTAKFILTIRDPYSWVDSFINHQLAHSASEKWLAVRDFRFRPDLYVHQPGEMILKDHGLYTVDGYLSYWGWHNRKALAEVPEEQLLIVRTDHISERIDDIAEFVGLPKGRLKREKSHSFKAAKKFGLLDQVDRKFIADRIEKHCGNLMTRFFPDLPAVPQRKPLEQSGPVPVPQPAT